MLQRFLRFLFRNPKEQKNGIVTTMNGNSLLQVMQDYPTNQIATKVMMIIKEKHVIQQPSNQALTLLKTFEAHLFKDDELSDLKIVCEGKAFPAHKFILSIRSDVFKAMFSSELKFNHSTQNELKIEDTDADTMEKFLKFIYTDSIKVEDVDCQLLMLADKYNVKALINKCIDILQAKMNVENVLEIIYSAYLTNNQQIIEAASKLILKNRGAVRTSAFWKELEEKNPSVACKISNLIIFGNQ